MTTSEHSSVLQFFDLIEPQLPAYTNSSFNYFAVRDSDQFILCQGKLLFHPTNFQPTLPMYNSRNVQAGCFKLSEMGITEKEFINTLLDGSVKTPDGTIRFRPDNGGRYSSSLLPYHPDGLQAQSRYTTLYISGGNYPGLVHRTDIDWELKGGSVPYESLQDLMYEYKVGSLQRHNTNVEVVAFNVAAVDGATSSLSGTSATISLNVAPGLSDEKVTIGYRAMQNGNVVKRSSIRGDALTWRNQGSLRRGTIDLEVPEGGLLQLFVNYNDSSQHYWWLADPATAQNPERAIYSVFDEDLAVLRDYITKSQSRGRDARDLEFGVAWLLWMLGFRVAHLGGTDKTRDSVDLIAATPLGNFAVVECTTGLLRTDNKLPLLLERSVKVRSALDIAGNRNVRLLTIMVTSKPKNEVQADLEQAEKLGVLVVTREGLENWINRTQFPAAPDALFNEAEAAVKSAQVKHAPTSVLENIAR